MKPYYSDDAVTIYHADAADLLPDLTADMVLTDPPYGIGVKYGEGSDDSRDDYWPWMREILGLMKCSAPLGAFTHRVTALRELTEWDWVGAWTKRFSAGSRLGNSMILPHWEPIFMWGIHTVGTASKHRSDVFEFNPERSGAVRSAGFGREGWAKNQGASHPAPKPLPLFRDLIATVGQTAGVILDPFAGSGTTLRAAKDLGRKALGIEIEERFCEIAARRMGQEVLALEVAP